MLKLSATFVPHPGARGTLLDTSVELWDQMFNTNVRGPFFLMQGFVKHRLDRGGGGAIVNILSQCAHCGQSYLSPYSSSKRVLSVGSSSAMSMHSGSRRRMYGST